MLLIFRIKTQSDKILYYACFIRRIVIFIAYKTCEIIILLVFSLVVFRFIQIGSRSGSAGHPETVQHVRATPEHQSRAAGKQSRVSILAASGRCQRIRDARRVDGGGTEGAGGAHLRDRKTAKGRSAAAACSAAAAEAGRSIQGEARDHGEPELAW